MPPNDSTHTPPGYDLRRCDEDTVERLCAAHHGYAGAGRVFFACFAVYEDGRPVAVYAWKPPPPGAAKSAAPDAPWSVLALSRMAAIPRGQRRLNHVSKPLRRQMRTLLDRGRWPVLLTYHDEGQGHTGHVYKCSGWTPTVRRKATTLTLEGVRVSRYANGITRTPEGAVRGETWLQRWEHRACAAGDEARHMAAAGWVREPIPGKVWRSGRQAFRIVRAPAQQSIFG